MDSPCDRARESGGSPRAARIEPSPAHRQNADSRPCAVDPATALLGPTTGRVCMECDDTREALQEKEPRTGGGASGPPPVTAEHPPSDPTSASTAEGAPGDVSPPPPEGNLCIAERDLFHRGVARGGRTWTALRLATRFRDGGLSEKEAVFLLLFWNERCRPPLAFPEVVHLAHLAYVPVLPRRLPCPVNQETAENGQALASRCPHQDDTSRCPHHRATRRSGC